MKSKVVLGVLLSVLCYGAGWAADEDPVLKSSGLPAGNPEAVLPGGAVLHLRANNLAGLVNTLNDLIMSFVPEKALPPELQPILQNPKPVLAFIGLNTGGEPLTVEALSAAFGIPLDKPITLSFYPMNPEEGFVLSVPMSDPKALTALLMNALRPRKFAPIQTGGKQGFQIIGSNPDLPRNFYVACSENRAYLCGSPMLAQMLFDAQPARLNKSEVVAKALAQHTASDVMLVLNTEVVKPLLEHIRKAYSQIPPQLIARARQRALRNLSPNDLQKLNVQLRLRTGINDVEQGLDYVEAIASASYEVLAQGLLDGLGGIDGAALSFKVGSPLQKLSLSYYSKNIKVAASTQPVPVDEVLQALAKIPGDRNSLSISGRQPKAEPCPYLIKWADALKAKFAAKNLPLGTVTAFADYARQLKAEQSLESQAPWTLRAAYAPPVRENIAASKVLDYVKAKFLNPAQSYTLTVLPGQDEMLIEKHFAALSQTSMDNQKAAQTLTARAEQEPSFLNYTSRFQASATQGKARKLVCENVYATSSGFFGYSQHEWINRQIIYSVKQGDYLFMHNSRGSEDTFLNGIDKLPVEPLAPAVGKLLALAPKDSSAIRTVRALNMLARALENLTKFENVARAELDGYLAKTAGILKGNQPADAKLAALRAIEAPVLVRALNMSKDGQPYLTLLGNLRYPRPQAMPVLAGLLKDFIAKSDAVGGAVAYERTQDGLYEAGAVVSTEALALLVKTTVNAFFETYVLVPNGQAKLRDAVVVPGDGQRPDGVVLYNPLWDFFDGPMNDKGGDF
jgi:hypothetical protein